MCQKFIVSALFFDFPILKYKNDVCIFYSRKTMGNHNNCFSLHQCLEALLYLVFILWISKCSCFIKDNNRSIF